MVGLWGCSSLHALNQPPKGFSQLFNGHDLTGFRGGDTFDHRKLLAMPEADRAAQIAKWTKTLTEIDAKTGKPNWHVENGDLVNGGTGAYSPHYTSNPTTTPSPTFVPSFFMMSSARHGRQQ
jgi:hypothetical protein